MKRWIRLNLSVDGRELAIALLDRDHPGSAFFTSKSFKVIYLKEAAGWTVNELGAAAERLRLLVALIERRLEALRACR